MFIRSNPLSTSNLPPPELRLWHPRNLMLASLSSQYGSQTYRCPRPFRQTLLCFTLVLLHHGPRPGTHKMSESNQAFDLPYRTGTGQRFSREMILREMALRQVVLIGGGGGSEIR